ncbi:hypothetical protein E3N88_39000 [Mikania micrantha]|uniref:Hydroxyproline-rich glycoprotein family protein n=1 Tax=Mikania micrantha TaxID=192012 RepID=A0A5N6LVI5_9ASTR|nr:hypothetical protein E3N88_39000 [Mikania micrantha]
MESPTYYPPPVHHSDSSHPTLGFPLGTLLLLIIIFCLSGLLSCCYHWEKLRRLRGLFSDDDHSPSKPIYSYSETLQTRNQSLPVVMPGDRIARFIALPCPCEPPRQEKLVVQVPPTHKSPHVAVTLC